MAEQNVEQAHTIEEEFAVVVAALLAGRVDGRQAIQSLAAIHRRVEASQTLVEWGCRFGEADPDVADYDGTPWALPKVFGPTSDANSWDYAISKSPTTRHLMYRERVRYPDAVTDWKAADRG